MNRERVIIFYILFTFRDLMIIYTKISFGSHAPAHIFARATQTVRQSSKIEWDGVVDLLIVSLHFMRHAGFAARAVCKHPYIYSFPIFDLINIILLIICSFCFFPLICTQLISHLVSRSVAFMSERFHVIWVWMERVKKLTNEENRLRREANNNPIAFYIRLYFFSLIFRVCI